MVSPREEARARLEHRYDARVLEPSPPTVTDAPWFADDPVATDGADAPVVTPVPGGTVTWDELAQDDGALAAWCADRWLGAWRRLPALDDPTTFATTRHGLHALAEHVLAPARYVANRKIGLRWTRGGFGTPFFGDDRQVRVEGTDLAVTDGRASTAAAITTVGDAAAQVDVKPGAPAGVFTSTTPLDPDQPLDIEPHAARLLSDWYGFASSVLEELRAEAPDWDATRVQLWPEHFDLSIDLGDEHVAARGTFGASPGDEEHEEPYLYVTHWAEVGADPFWNDTTFGGASLRLSDLTDASDQRAAALAFFRSGRAILESR